MSTLQEEVILEGILPLDINSGSKCRVIITKTHIACCYNDDVANDNGSCDVVANLNEHVANNIQNVANGNSQLVANSYNHLAIKPSNADTVTYFDDVIGCHCQPVVTSDLMHNEGSGGSAICLTVYAYPHSTRAGNKQASRFRKTLTFLFNQHNTLKRNAEEASRWQKVIQSLCRSSAANPGTEEMASLDLRQLLIIVNPFSGRGKAEQTFREVVQPMLHEGNIKYHIVVTKQAGHAMKYVHNTRIENWTGIVVVSGDGLIHEVINGLMTRQDWKIAIETPLGVVPAGSGNALAASLLYAAGETYVDNYELYSTYHLIKHTPAPLDLMSVDLGSGRRLYSFLQLAWGLVSDVDIESERYRSLGSARITLCAIIRIANLRKYRGRVSFLPVDPNYKPKRPLIKPNTSRGGGIAPYDRRDHHLQIRADYSRDSNKRTFQYRQDHRASNGESESSDVNTDSEEEMEKMEELEKMNDMGEVETFYDVEGDDDERTLKDEDMEDDQNINNDINRVNNVKDFHLACAVNDLKDFHLGNTENASGKHDDEGNIPDDYIDDGIERRFLPQSFYDPVPDDWMTMEEDFVSIIANMHTHANQDLIFAPGAKADDGCIHLLMAYNGLSRLDLVRLLSEGDTRRLAAGPNLEIIKVKAFRIIPLTPGEIMTVDGERVEYGPIQAEMLPSLGRVMAGKACAHRHT